MLILPAIDLRHGKVVRLSRGDLDEETVYASEPLDVAEAFVEAGARWIHIVDLDGAAAADTVQIDVIARIVKATGLQVQAGGGIRSEEAAQRMLDAGVSRIVVGTAAVKNPALLDRLLEQHGERVVVGIDARAGEAAVYAWTEGSGTRAVDLARSVAARGVRRLVVTDIATDGMLAGPGLGLLMDVAVSSGVPIIASGGVATEHDLVSLQKLGTRDGVEIEGVIIGRALYEGTLSLATVIRRFQD